MQKQTPISSTDLILKKIKAVSTVTAEIITRIRAVSEVSSYSYLIKTTAGSDGFPVVSFEEIKSSEPTADALRRKLSSLTKNLLQTDDIFNDHIDYNTMNSLDDVENLNRKLLLVAQKYELFGDSDRARKELEKFLHNFEVRKKFAQISCLLSFRYFKLLLDNLKLQ
jgi:hypothetical protein